MIRQVAVAAWLFGLVSSPVQAQAESEATPSATTSAAPCPDEDEDEGEYARQGQFEVGGSVSGSWSPDAFELSVSPSVGYFFVDRVELSLILQLDYENETLPLGGRSDAFSFALLLEPSYHLPLSEALAVFAGLGVGYAREEGEGALDLEPRVGLNIDVGRSGILTPEISVPILFGRQTATGEVGTTASLSFGAGFTSTF
jgi:hypothetical protein